MGEITEPCGRPILVWNHTPVWSFTIHLASRWLRNAFIQFHMFPLNSTSNTAYFLEIRKIKKSSI
jgi:hypothetical protein